MAAEHIVFLPGMMCDERLWQAQIQALNIPFCVPRLDQHDNFVDMALEVLAQQSGPFAIAGLSMGGILAFEIWRQAPHRVSHLALMDTNPFAETAERQSLRPIQIEQALNGELRELAIDSLKPLYLAKSKREDPVLLGTILDMALDLGPEVFRRQSLALANRNDSSATLRTITCPTAVICGNEDSLCPVKYHSYMAENIANSTLSVIDDCGHLASLEQADTVNRILLSLLAKD